MCYIVYLVSQSAASGAQLYAAVVDLKEEHITAAHMHAGSDRALKIEVTH